MSTGPNNNEEVFFGGVSPTSTPKTNDNDEEALKLFKGYVDAQAKQTSTGIKEKKAKQDIKLRKKHASSISVFSLCWCIFIALIIIAHGCFNFLNQTEFIFVCGTLTTSIFAFYLIVIRNLFPNKDNKTKAP